MESRPCLAIEGDDRWPGTVRACRRSENGWRGPVRFSRMMPEGYPLTFERWLPGALLERYGPGDTAGSTVNYSASPNSPMDRPGREVMITADYLDVWVTLSHESRIELLTIALDPSDCEPSQALVDDLRSVAGLSLDSSHARPTLEGSEPRLSLDFMRWVHSVADPGH